MLSFKITNSLRIKRLNNSITQKNTLKYEVLDFIGIVCGYFNLKPGMKSSVEWYMTKLLNDYRMLCNRSKFENIVLAVTLYVCNTSRMAAYENIDISGFVNSLWRIENRKRELVSIYGLYQNIQDILNDSDPRITIADEVKMPIWKS
jgi:hypothetical protein